MKSFNITFPRQRTLSTLTQQDMLCGNYVVKFWYYLFPWKSAFTLLSWVTLKIKIGHKTHGTILHVGIQGFTLNAQYREGTIFFLSPASHEIMRYCVTHGSHTASCSSVVCDTPTRGWRNTMHCVLLWALTLISGSWHVSYLPTRMTWTYVNLIRENS